MISLVPEAIASYATACSSPEPGLLAELAAETRTSMKSPQMMVGHTEGLFLKLLVRALGARHILEIGTFTGYSALAMASALPDDGRIITCDVDRESTAIARAYWDRSPHGRKITLELRPALETIAGLAGPFDLVFIDADKPAYIEYWDACVPRVRAGGAILVDNVLWSGKVLEPREKDDHAIAAFNRHAARDSRVETVLLPIRDGITMAIKR